MLNSKANSYQTELTLLLIVSVYSQFRMTGTEWLGLQVLYA